MRRYCTSTGAALIWMTMCLYPQQPENCDREHLRAERWLLMGLLRLSQLTNKELPSPFCRGGQGMPLILTHFESREPENRDSLCATDFESQTLTNDTFESNAFELNTLVSSAPENRDTLSTNLTHRVTKRSPRLTLSTFEGSNSHN
jgi:hypothetical protein